MTPRRRSGIKLGDFPELAQEWDHQTNGTPADTVPFRSRTKFWWICSTCKYRWQASPDNRAGGGRGCPRCANRVVDSTNCLATTHPELAGEWHPTLNTITPEEVVAGSNRKAWWMCRRCNKAWDAVIASRALSGNGCRHCKGWAISQAKLVPTQGRSLADQAPAIAALFDAERNGRTAAAVSVGNSRARWWWRCEAGHVWQRTVAHQVAAKKVCPDCTNSRASASYNIAMLHPELAAEWHPILNSDHQPTEFTPGSEFMAWWRCRVDACGHVWQAMIGNRARLGVGCPRCGDRRVSEFFRTPRPGRSLADLFPGLVAEWHPTRNPDLTPYNVNPGAQVKVWWRCDTCGHDWRTRVENRAVKGTGCPACANKVVTATNNLAAVRPELAAEWHPVWNAGMEPQHIVPGAEIKVWWRCGNGHEWQALVYSRSVGTGCPHCDVRPRSRAEIRLACELSTVIDFDLDLHKVRAMRDDGSPVVLDCDIVIDGIKTIVEYDGAYWHTDQDERDNAKTAAIVRAGYWCIRVRELPLPAVHASGRTDVVVRANQPAHLVAGAVLHQIALRFPDLDQKVQEYRDRAAPQADGLANDEIRRRSR